MDKTGKYFHIKNPASINRILRFLNLPEVEEGIPELGSITKSRFDLSQYRWDNYPPGILTIEKVLCPDTDSLVTFHCIITLTINNRY
jgi:hypothetical protein